MNASRLGLALAALAAPAWAAGPVYIPPPPLEVSESYIQVEAVAAFGQSFTPTMSSVGSIWLRATNMNLGFPLSEDKWLVLNLHEGEGFGGPLLASATANVEAAIGTEWNGSGLVEFSVGNVPVVSGQVYSFEVKAATARYGISWQTTNWYGDGNAFILGGPLAQTDLYFSVAATVPELASYQLLLLALASAAGGSWLRRRQLTTPR